MKVQDDAARTIEYVGAQLLLAGWLQNFESGEKADYTFNWSPNGARRAVLMRRVVEDFELAESPREAKRFTESRQEAADVAAEKHRAVCQDFWLSCLGEISLDLDPRHLWALARIIHEGAAAPVPPHAGN